MSRGSIFLYWKISWLFDIGKMMDVDMVLVRDLGGGKNDGEYYINVREFVFLKNFYLG